MGHAIEDEPLAAIQPSMEGGKAAIIDPQTTVEVESKHPNKEEQHGVTVKGEGDTPAPSPENEDQPINTAEVNTAAGGEPAAESSVAESRDHLEGSHRDVTSINASEVVGKGDITEETETASNLGTRKEALSSFSGLEETSHKGEALLRLNDQESDSQTPNTVAGIDLNEPHSKASTIGEEDRQSTHIPPSDLVGGEADKEALPNYSGQESVATGVNNSIPDEGQWDREAQRIEDNSKSLTYGRSMNEDESEGLQTRQNREEPQVSPERPAPHYQKPEQDNQYQHVGSGLVTVQEAEVITEASGGNGVTITGENPVIDKEDDTKEKTPTNISVLLPTEVKDREESKLVKDSPVTPPESESYKGPIVQERLPMSEALGPSVSDLTEQQSTPPLPPKTEEVNIGTYNKVDTASDQQEWNKTAENQPQEATGSGTGISTLKELSPNDESEGRLRRDSRRAVRRPKGRKRHGQEQSPPKENSPPAVLAGEGTAEERKQVDTLAPVIPPSDKENTSATGEPHGSQPALPVPIPRARRKTPEPPNKEDTTAKATPTKEEEEQKGTAPLEAVPPPLIQHTPPEEEAAVSPPESPVLRRSSRTVSRASRGTLLNSSRRRQHADTAASETADTALADKQIPTASCSPGEMDQPPTEHIPSSASEGQPTNRAIAARTPGLQPGMTNMSNIETNSQLGEMREGDGHNTQGPPGREEVAYADFSLSVSESERERRCKSPLPGLEESIDISNFNLSPSPSPIPPEKSEESAPPATKMEERQLQPPPEDQEQEDEFQIRRGSRVLSMSTRPQALLSRRKQKEERETKMVSQSKCHKG